MISYRFHGNPCFSQAGAVKTCRLYRFGSPVPPKSRGRCSLFFGGTSILPKRKTTQKKHMYILKYLFPQWKKRKRYRCQKLSECLIEPKWSSVISVALPPETSSTNQAYQASCQITQLQEFRGPQLIADPESHPWKRTRLHQASPRESTGGLEEFEVKMVTFFLKKWWWI